MATRPPEFQGQNGINSEASGKETAEGMASDKWEEKKKSVKKKINAADFYLKSDKHRLLNEEFSVAPGFAEHYNVHIHPILLELENQRLHQVKILLIRMGGAFLAAIILIVLLPLSGALGLLADLAILGGAAFWAYNPSRYYREDYKHNILPHILSFYPDLSYKTNGTLPADILTPSGITPDLSRRYHSEDMIYGTYNGVHIGITEVRCEGSNGTSGTEKKFSGLFVLLQFPPESAEHTQQYTQQRTQQNTPHHAQHIIITKQDYYKALPQTVQNNFDEFTPKEGQLHKRFKIFTKNLQFKPNHLEAVVNRLFTLSRCFRNSTLSAAAYEDKFFITIPFEQNLFEPASILKPVQVVSDLHILLSLISLIQETIETIQTPPKPEAPDATHQ